MEGGWVGLIVLLAAGEWKKHDCVLLRQEQDPNEHHSWGAGPGLQSSPS